MYSLMLFALCGTSFAKDYPVQLGDETVIIHQIRLGHGKAFVHVHQNEVTALAAAKKIVHAHGGSILTLKHSGGRNIVFHLQGKRYEFDPNRIYTDSGIKKSLSNFGSYSPEAHHLVKKLAERITSLLPKGKIIAVHNNESYSLKDYLPGNELHDDAKALHFHHKDAYRNFFLVTKKQDFKRLKSLNFNSILQAIHAEDDGSLSIFLAHKHYINVEAGYDQLAAQVRMLKYA